MRSRKSRPRSANHLPMGWGLPSTRDDVKQLSGPDVDQLGREVSVVERSDPDHEHLVEAEGRDLTDAVDVGLEQRLPVVDDRPVHRVPVAPELAGHLVHAPGVLADLAGSPTGRTGR